jgi:hypothetical protein
MLIFSIQTWSNFISFDLIRKLIWCTFDKAAYKIKDRSSHRARAIGRCLHRTPRQLLSIVQCTIPPPRVPAAAPRFCRCFLSSAQPARLLRHHRCKALLTRPWEPAADQHPEPEGAFEFVGAATHDPASRDGVGGGARPDNGGVAAERDPLYLLRRAWTPQVFLLHTWPAADHLAPRKTCRPPPREQTLHAPCGSNGKAAAALSRKFNPLLARILGTSGVILLGRLRKKR